MKRALLLSLAVSIASIGIGHAADMSVKAQRAVASPPTLSWSYIGANGGWGWSDYNISESPFGTTGVEDLVSQSVGTRANGGVFGGQIGPLRPMSVAVAAHALWNAQLDRNVDASSSLSSWRDRITLLGVH